MENFNYVNEMLNFLGSQDAETAEYIMKELNRQKRNVELIASENIVSEAVMAAMGSCLTNKYAEGYPEEADIIEFQKRHPDYVHTGKSGRYYGGCEHVNGIELLAMTRACKLFGAEHANVQPHSGANANLAAFMAVVKPGETVMGMSLANGGHLSHGSPANISGKYFNIVPYDINPETEMLDYNKIYEIAQQCHPKMIIAGASAYPRAIDFKKFREIADSVGAKLMVDMAHIAGLVAAGLHMNPVPYADIVTTTTHKTLRGPRGGLILCKEEMANKIDSAVFPGTQGGPLMHIIAGKAVSFGEALKPEFNMYQQQIIKNTAALADELQNQGFRLVSGGTDNHMALVDVRNFNVTGREMQNNLDEVYITANKNAIPNDPEKVTVTSGIRVGSAAVTTRGFKENDMKLVGRLIGDTARDFEGNKEKIREEIINLCAKYPIYENVYQI